MVSRVITLVLMALVLCSFSGRAQSPARSPEVRRLVNVDREGLALQGYDPVAFHTLGKAVPGRSDLAARFDGATYRFASAEHRTLFEGDPGRYAPAFGGYCAYGVSQGGLFPVDISTAQILDGRLVLNKNPRVRALFDRAPGERMRQADGEWPGLIRRHGKPAAGSP